MAHPRHDFAIDLDGHALGVDAQDEQQIVQGGGAFHFSRFAIHNELHGRGL